VAVTQVYAALTIDHERLSAKSVTERLGIQPSSSFEIGDPFLGGTKQREHSHWSLDSDLPRDGSDLEGHLRQLLDRFLPLRADLGALVAEGYTLDWWCFISEENDQGGVYLSTGLLQDLAVLPVPLALDIYAGSGQDE
jgi:hypothetical protein